MTSFELYQRAVARQQRLRRQRASCRMEENIARVEFAEPEPRDEDVPSPRFRTEAQFLAWTQKAKPTAKRTRRVKRQEWEFVEPNWDWDGVSHK